VINGGYADFGAGIGLATSVTAVTASRPLKRDIAKWPQS
jgi:hypothetical protein